MQSLAMQPVRIYTCHDEAGNIYPLRFRVEDEESCERLTVNIDKVLQREEDKVAGRRRIRFRCCSLIDNRVQQYDLCFELATCRWFLVRW